MILTQKALHIYLQEDQTQKTMTKPLGGMVWKRGCGVAPTPPFLFMAGGKHDMTQSTSSTLTSADHMYFLAIREECAGWAFYP